MNRRAFLAVTAGLAASASSRAQVPQVSPVPTPRNWNGDPHQYPDPDIVAILVRVPDRPDLRIRARQGYYAPRSEPRPGAAVVQVPPLARAEIPTAR